MSQQGTRPGQATFAGWLIIGGSVILVITAWQRISSLHTLEVQEELNRILSEPPVSGTGLGLEAMQTTVRVLCMVAAGAATAATILGFQALRRSTSARLALTVLAPLVLIGGFATAGFFAPMVVAGTAMLWLQPTRDWFAGRPWSTARQRAAQAPRSGPDPFAAPPGHDAAGNADAPPAAEVPAAGGGDRPPPHHTPYGEPPSEQAPTAFSPYRPPARPGALVGACVTVWVSTTIATGFLLLLSLVMAVARDDLFAEVERQQPDFDMGGFTHAELATATFVLTGILVVWCVAAAVLAILTFRRVSWARIALAVCCAGTAALSLAASLVNPLLVVVVAAASVTLWLLLRPDVTAWFRADRRR